ncbi:hypothetical protein [Corynebacterium kalidii]
MTTHTVMTPRDRRNTLRTRTVAALAATLTTALVLVGCGSDDSVDPPSTGAAATTGQNTSPPDTDVPQVGSGTGLADTDYVELDQAALTTGLDARDVDDHDPASVLVRGLQTAFSWHPATDSSQFDAFVRASSAWNNTYLRSQETRLTTLIAMSMRDWTDWGDREQIFYPTVTLTNETHPADTGTDFSRVVTIDMATGTTDDPDAGRDVLTIIGQARVHNSPEGWRIETFEVRDTVVGEQ